MRTMAPPTGPESRRRQLHPEALFHAVTLLGRTVLALSLIAWFVGWWLGWDEYLLVAAGCLVAAAAALVFTLGTSSLQVSLDVEPPRLVVGEPAVGRLQAVNTSSRMFLPLRLEAPVGEGVARIDVPALAADEQFEQVFVIPTTHRSVITVGPVSSIRGDPLGLARRVLMLTESTKLFIHPRTVPVSGITAGWIRDLEGRPTNDLSDSDVAFHALREYVPGDDRRHIHWRTTARLGGRMMVRQFVDTRRVHLGLVMSTNAEEYTDANEFEMAISAVGSLGRSAFADRQPMTCVVGRAIVASPNPQRFLDGLAAIGAPVAGHTLLHTAHGALPLVRAASVVMVVTGGAATISQLNATADVFPANVRVVAMRCGTGGRRSITPTAKTKVLDLSQLEDLPSLLYALARR